jgi:hypothetical protein
MTPLAALLRARWSCMCGSGPTFLPLLAIPAIFPFSAGFLAVDGDGARDYGQLALLLAVLGSFFSTWMADVAVTIGFRGGETGHEFDLAWPALPVSRLGRHVADALFDGLFGATFNLVAFGVGVAGGALLWLSGHPDPTLWAEHQASREETLLLAALLFAGCGLLAAATSSAFTAWIRPIIRRVILRLSILVAGGGRLPTSRKTSLYPPLALALAAPLLLPGMAVPLLTMLLVFLPLLDHGPSGWARPLILVTYPALFSTLVPLLLVGSRFSRNRRSRVPATWLPLGRRQAWTGALLLSGLGQATLAAVYVLAWNAKTIGTAGHAPFNGVLDALAILPAVIAVGLCHAATFLRGPRLGRAGLGCLVALEAAGLVYLFFFSSLRAPSALLLTLVLATIVAIGLRPERHASPAGAA